MRLWKSANPLEKSLLLLLVFVVFLCVVSLAIMVNESDAFIPDAKSCEYMLNGNWRINSIPTECLAEALEARKK